MISSNSHLTGTLLLVGIAITAAEARATNGYFTHGTGVRAQAVAGGAAVVKM